MLPPATLDEPVDDEPNVSLTRETWETLAPLARSAVDVNDPGSGRGRAGRAGLRPGQASTAALKTRWDPDNLFHLNANIPPIPDHLLRGA
jgi:hypothetical protein